MIKNNLYKKQIPYGFTLIEIVIYCAIFITFAVFVMESMIWINSKMSMEDKLTDIRKDNVYKIYFASIYKRYKMDNVKIETEFKELIASTSKSTPLIKEDRDMGIIFNQMESKFETQIKKEEYKIILFDSIGF